MNDFKLTISSLIIYTLDILLIFLPCSFTTIAIILKLKKLFITPISLEVFLKVHFLHWNPMEICLKSAKFSHFPYLFCISALGIFSIRYTCMKTTVNNHQMVKLKKLFTSWIGPWIISKSIFSPQNWHNVADIGS